MKAKNVDPESRAWGLFLAVHTLLLERIEAALAQACLPALAYYDVLWELEKSTGGRLRMHELANRMVLSRSNLSRLADRLERDGLLRREACEDDRRGSYCTITEAGRKMRKKMWPVYREQIECLFASHLSSTEANVMVVTLEKILRAVKAI